MGLTSRAHKEVLQVLQVLKVDEERIMMEGFCYSVEMNMLFPIRSVMNFGLKYQ